jgi:hypothetical protein
MERLAILITADAAGALSEMKKVAAGAEKDLGKAGTEGSKLSTNMTKVGAGMVAAGAGLLAVGISAADTATSLGREVMKLQRYTGMTAEDASKLGYAAKMSGVPVDSLATGLGKLSKSMENGSPVFDKLGISARGSDGKLRTMGDFLPDLAEKFKNMPNGPEKTAAALGLFGRAGMDLMPFLNKGKEGIKQLSDEAEKMGLVLSQDNIVAIKHHITSQRELKAALDGVKTQIGLSMIPVLDVMTDTFKNIPGPVYDVIGPLTVFGGLGLTAAGGISLIVGQLKNLKTMAVDAYGGIKNFLSSFSGMGASLGPFVILIAAAAAGMWDLQRRSNEASKAAKETLGDLSSKTPTELKTQLDAVNESLKTISKETAPEGSYSLGTLWDKMTGKESDKDSLKKQKVLLEEAITAVNNSIGPTKTLADAERAAADETNNHSAAAQLLNDVLTKSFDPFTNAIGAADKMAESQRKLKETTQNIFFAQLDLTAAIRDHGKASPEAVKAADDLAEANRNLDSAQAGAFDSAIKYEESITTLKASMKDHPEIYQQNIDKITKMYAEGEISADTFERMRSKLVAIAQASGALPDVKVNVDSHMVDEAMNKIFALNRAAHTPTAYNFSSLPGYSGSMTGYNPTPGVDLSWMNDALGGRVGPGMAMGGRASGPILTGELGPEIFWPDSAGTIITAEKTKQMLSSSGGGTSVTNVTINMPPGSNGAEVVNAIRRYEKTNGTSWRN